MGPRVAGIALMGVSALIGVLEGAWVASPPRSILAAIALSAATVGMGVGVLWLPRRGWADRTWPPAGRDQDPRTRARKASLWLAFIMLTPVPVGLALIVWLSISGELTGGQRIILVLICGVYTAAGLALMFATRSISRPASVSVGKDAHPADVEGRTAKSGWVSLRSRAPAPEWPGLFVAGPSVVVLLILPLQMMIVVRKLRLLLLILAVQS